MLNETQIKEAIEKVEDSIYAFSKMTKEERGEKRIVMKAVEFWGPSLKYADKALRDDKEVVLTAVKQMGSALTYAGFKMRDDKEVVLTAIKQEGCQAHVPNDKTKTVDIKKEDVKNVVNNVLK